MAVKTVSNSTPKAILDACASSGIDPFEILSKTKLGRDIIERPDGRTDFEDVVRLWESSYARTGDRMIGIHAARCLPFGTFKVIDYMMASSTTPKDGLSKALNYYPLINEGFDLSVRVADDFGYVELHNPYDPQVVPFQYVDFVFACVLSRVRFSTGTGWNPTEIRLTCPEPADTREYRRTFRCPVSFAQPVNQMVLDRDSLEIIQPNADAHLCEMLDRHASHLLKRSSPEKDVLFELSRILRKSLPEGRTGLSHSARKMGMSRRSLQRKLKRKGVSYRELLNKIRFETATDLLNQNDITIEETAFLVGYSEKSSFYRAFKQWTGKTPQDFKTH